MRERRFNLEDQQAFARLSGDTNPLHLDPVAARRLIFGEAVVHGVHGLLWALDLLFEEEDGPVELTRLAAAFESPLGLDRPVFGAVVLRARGSADLELRDVDDRRVSLIKAAWSPAGGDPSPPGDGLPASGTPRVLHAENAAHLEGHRHDDGRVSCLGFRHVRWRLSRGLDLS